MNAQISDIEIIFENMDFVKIPFEHIGELEFQIKLITLKNVNRNKLQRSYSAKSIYFEILNTFECKQEEESEYVDIYEDFTKRIFENDITYLRIHYKNSTNEDIWVPWKDYDDNEYKNQYQKVEIDVNQNYVVRIEG